MYISNNTAFTFKNNTGNAAKVTKVTITALKQPAAINVDITNPGTLATGATGTFTYTKDSEVENTKVWSSNDDDVIEIKNAATGAYEAKGRGTATITLTITPTDATNYKSVSAERSVNVTAPVEITASDVEMTFGDAAKAIGATTSAYYAGTLTYESGNTSIATVDASGNVTAFSAGTTTITISAPADAEHLYTAGEDVVINVTVNAMAGAEETPEVTEGNIYYTNLKSTPTGWNKDTNWSYHSTYGAVTTSGETSGTYDLTSKEIDLSGLETSKVISMDNLFSGCTSLEKINLNNLDTSNVNSMISMFKDCNKLKELNMEKFTTENIIFTDSMFENCYNLPNINIDYFDLTNNILL